MNSENATPTRRYETLVMQPDHDPLRTYWRSEYMDNPTAPRGPGIDTELRTPVGGQQAYTDANLVSSRMRDLLGDPFVTRDGLHVPTLDIDFPCRVVPSTTPGHNHLLMDKALTWPEYTFLLQAMAAVGLLEKGFVEFSIARGASFVRTPWQKKVCNSQGLDITTDYDPPNAPAWGVAASPVVADAELIVSAATALGGYDSTLPEDRGMGGAA